MRMTGNRRRGARAHQARWRNHCGWPASRARLPLTAVGDAWATMFFMP